MGNFIGSVVKWPFLNEPAWRWAVFVGMILFLLLAWRGVLRHM